MGRSDKAGFGSGLGESENLWGCPKADIQQTINMMGLKPLSSVIHLNPQELKKKK